MKMKTIKISVITFPFFNNLVYYPPISFLPFFHVPDIIFLYYSFARLWNISPWFKCPCKSLILVFSTTFHTPVFPRFRIIPKSRERLFKTLVGFGVCPNIIFKRWCFLVIPYNQLKSLWCKVVGEKKLNFQRRHFFYF
jgi:hypothetical protein